MPNHIYTTYLSISILLPVIKIVSGLDLLIVFKFLLPVILSLIAPIVFVTYSKAISYEWAFISTVFLLIDSTFRQLIPGILLGSIAILLFTLLLNRICCDKDRGLDNAFVVLLLLLGVVTAHYFTAIMLLVVFIMSYLSLLTIKRSKKLHSLDTININVIWRAKHDGAFRDINGHS